MEDNLKKMCNKFSANTFCQSLNCFSIFNLLEAIETRFFVAELFPVGHKKVIEGEPRNNPSEFLSFPIVTWQWNNYKSVTPRTSRVTRPQLTRINLRRSSYQNILVAYIAGISEFLRGSKMCNMPSKKFGSLFKHLSYAKYRGLAVKWGPECCLAQPGPAAETSTTLHLYTRDPIIATNHFRKSGKESKLFKALFWTFLSRSNRGGFNVCILSLFLVLTAAPGSSCDPLNSVIHWTHPSRHRSSI